MSATTVVKNNLNFISPEKNETINSKKNKRSYFEVISQNQVAKIQTTFVEIVPQTDGVKNYKRKKESESPRTFSCICSRPGYDADERTVKHIQKFGNVIINQNRPILLIFETLPDISEIQICYRAGQEHLVQNLCIENKPEEKHLRTIINIPKYWGRNIEQHYHLICKSKDNVLYKSPKLYLYSKSNEFRDRIGYVQMKRKRKGDQSNKKNCKRKSENNLEEAAISAKVPKKTQQFSAPSSLSPSKNLLPSSQNRDAFFPWLIEPILGNSQSSSQQSSVSTLATHNFLKVQSNFGVLSMPFLGAYLGNPQSSSQQPATNISNIPSFPVDPNLGIFSSSFLGSGNSQAPSQKPAANISITTQNPIIAPNNLNTPSNPVQGSHPGNSQPSSQHSQSGKISINSLLN